MALAPGDSPTRGLDTLYQKGDIGSLMGARFPRRNIKIPANYMTLRPKFYAKLVSAITRRRMDENQRFLADFVQHFMYIVNLLSKQDFKHFSKIDILGFAAIVFENIPIFGPCGHIKGALLQNIQICWPLRAY